MKRILFVVFLIFTLLLTGCGYSDAKKESKQKVNQYSDYFKQQVREIYGESAKLKNIKCEVYSGARSSLPETTYWASDTLTADLILNNNIYHAVLDIKENTIRTDIYSNDIIQDLISFFPIDLTKVIYINSDNAIGSCDEVTLDSSIKNLSDCLQSDFHLNIYIITTENLDNIKEEDFLASTLIEDLKDSQMTFCMHIFSVSSEDNIEELKKRIKDIQIGSYDDMPKLMDLNSTQGDASGLNITNLIEFNKLNKDFFGYRAYSSN